MKKQPFRCVLVQMRPPARSAAPSGADALFLRLTEGTNEEAFVTRGCGSEKPSHAAKGGGWIGFFFVLEAYEKSTQKNGEQEASEDSLPCGFQRVRIVRSWFFEWAAYSVEVHMPSILSTPLGQILSEA
ncbi:MAG: hypothetical protein O2960_13820 [Verrucomicrobia bacterium]|nr:hypothetical protein [Verrucomicrobiota bacterium]